MDIPDSIDYKLLVEHALDVITLLTPEGVILYESPSIESVIGYNPQELIGKKVFDYLTPDDMTRILGEIAWGVAHPGQTKTIEVQFRHKNGSWVWLEASSLMLLGGSFSGILVNSRDITRRKEVEHSLSESEARYRNLIEKTPDAIFVHAKGFIKYVNQAAITLLGAKDSQDLLGKEVLAYVDPAFHNIVKQRITNQIEEHRDVPLIEERFVRIDGTTIDVVVRGIPIVFDGDQAALVIVRDITDRKKAEAELDATQKKYHIIIDTLGDSIHLINREMRIELVNAEFMAWMKKLGLSEEPYGKNLFDQFPFLSRTVKEEYDEVFRTGITKVSEDCQEINGKILCTETRKIGIKDGNEVKQVLTVIRDITVEKRAKEDMLKEKLLSDTIIESLPGVFYLFTNEGKIIRFNKKFAQVTGWSQEEIQHMSPEDFVEESEKNKAGQSIQEVFSKGQTTLQAHIRTKNGTIIPFLLTGQLVTYDNKQCVVGVGIDQSKEAEAKMAEVKSQEQFKFLVDNVMDVVTMIGDDGIIEYNSPSIEHVLGYTPSEHLNKRILEFVHPDDQQKVASAISQAFNTATTGTVNAELRYMHKDGSWRYLEALGKAISDESGKRKIMINSRDISTRKEIEATLSRKNDELEKINKLMIGREMKMIEMKKRLKQLDPTYDPTN
jgi:two-component system, NarL family, sensor histidine kinase ComP